MTRDQFNLKKMLALSLVFSLALILAGCPVDYTPRILQIDETPAVPEATPAIDDPGIAVREVEEDEIAAEAQPLEEAEIIVLPEEDVETPAVLEGEAIETLDLSEVLMRATFLVNREVEQADGESIGTVDDLVIDVDSGRILYVIFTYGGVLGVGGNTVAAPPRAFNWSPGLNMRLMVHAEDLELLPTVDDEWPLAGDDAWDDEISAFWSGTGVDVADEPGMNLIRAMRLIDLQAGQIGGPVGVVEDLLLNLGEHQVHYFAVHTTPGFGAGDFIIFMPFELLTVELLAGERVPGIFVEDGPFMAAPAMDRDLFMNVDFLGAEVIEPFETYWSELGYPVAPVGE